MEDRTNNEPEVPDETKKGKVIDLLIPIICLVVCCVIGMIYTGGYTNYELMVISISACMAGAVCGDHCLPISDTTIMASAGAECDHVNHVSTQLPYAMVAATVSFISYIIAGFVQNPWISLPIAIVIMVLTLCGVRYITNKKEE